VQDQRPPHTALQDTAGVAAVWPGRKAVLAIGSLFALVALVAVGVAPGSPLRGLPVIRLGLSLPAPGTEETQPAAPRPVAVEQSATNAPVDEVVAPETPAQVLAVAAPDAQPIARAAWRAPDVPRRTYPRRIERWRPLVRQLIGELWNEGRMDGPASALDDDLVLAVIQQESGGDPDAESWAGAIGLMQVMPFTFAEMMAGDKALADQIDPAVMFDVPSNVRAGLRYLALAMNAHEGNYYWALASYNAGIEAVDDWRAVGLYAVPPVGGYEETANYAQVILRSYIRHRPDVVTQIHVPDPMPPEHVPGAIELLVRAGRW